MRPTIKADARARRCQTACMMLVLAILLGVLVSAVMDKGSMSVASTPPNVQVTDR